MNAILQKVLSLDGKISNGTDNYLDDILVNEDVVRADEVATHLANYGLRCKEAEKVADGTKLLGLWVESSSNGSLRWKRGASVPEVGEVISTVRALLHLWSADWSPSSCWLAPCCLRLHQAVKRGTSMGR